MGELVVKFIKLNDKAVIPDYQTEHASGMDLHACLDGSIILKPMDRAIVPTGIAVELPIGYEAQIRARSGLSIKHGLTMVNGIGTIDSDFRGEIGILAINLGQEDFQIDDGMRVAQMVICKYEHVRLEQVNSLNESVRGDGAYGSTGIDSRSKNGII